MSMNLSPPEPMGPLSVGNVVSASLRLYRDRFKLYYGLAFTGYLWSIIPIYGWAKFSAISGLISRLAFSELIERPETVNEARSQVMPRMWSFLGAKILVGLIWLGMAFGAAIVFSILLGVFIAISRNNPTTSIVLILLGLIAFIAFLIVFIRLVSRLLIFEVPLAIESNLDAISTISRAWQLTKGFVSRIQWIVLVAFLITLPIIVVIQIISASIQGFVGTLFPRTSGSFFLVYYLLFLPFSIASGSLVIPFWRVLNVLIYYDLCNRREGLGLQISDSRPQ